MSSKIIHDIYKSILSYSALTVAADGSVVTCVPRSDARDPMTVESLPLVYPDDRQFKSTNLDKIYFHPFCENFQRGESSVIEQLRRCQGIRINLTVHDIIKHLLRLLASHDMHKRLTPENNSILSIFSEIDKQTATSWDSLGAKLFKESRDGAFVKFYIRSPGSWKNKPYSRVGVVTFPFYKMLVSDEPAFRKKHGLRIRDTSAYKQIMEFLFPSIAGAEAYNYGAQSLVSPYLETLMMTSLNVTSQLNLIITAYQDFIPEASEYLFDTDWAQYFDNLDSLIPEIRKMPKFDKGNAGTIPIQDRKHPAQPLPTPTHKPAAAPDDNTPPWEPQPTTTAPTQTPAVPEPKTTPSAPPGRRTIDMSQLIGAMPAPRVPQGHQPAPPGYPQPSPFAQPQQPWQPQFNPAPPNRSVLPPGGFASLLTSSQPAFHTVSRGPALGPAQPAFQQGPGNWQIRPI